ncbi:ParB N-terminal domain-containing protein [Nocardioides sp.]|uniref:LigA n=1 Tax=metagenome TaxID=256318 RepID=A0A2P2BX76_9ZZZZ
MADINGHIELERSIDSIIIGVRHRKELGDLVPLMTSIQERGLLQPITITPDGVLVCGRRRLEAVKLLGWRTLKVWVRSGISDNLSRLLSEQDENALRKPLTPTEESALFEELKELLAEDAARRQEASRFGSSPTVGGENGGADSAPPSPLGKARNNAAKLVTGKASHQRLEQINTIKRTAADPTVAAVVRDLAGTELRAIDDGADVAPAFHRIKAAIELTGGQLNAAPLSRDELEALAAEALARVKQERARGGGRIRPPHPDHQPSQRSLRAFILTWSDLDGWSKHHDATEVGQQLSESDWATFERVLAETEVFADAARRARQRIPQPASA